MRYRPGVIGSMGSIWNANDTAMQFRTVISNLLWQTDVQAPAPAWRTSPPPMPIRRFRRRTQSIPFAMSRPLSSGDIFVTNRGSCARIASQRRTKQRDMRDVKRQFLAMI